MSATQYWLRAASLDDLADIRAFYSEHHTRSMPAPSNAMLVAALTHGRVLLIENDDERETIVGASAVFDFSPPGCSSYVGELSGTRVTSMLGGCSPLSVQRLFLAARLLGYVAMERPLGHRSSSLITIVHRANERSLSNVAEAGFVEFRDRPDWIAYDELHWNGAAAGQEWVYFLATDETVRQAVSDLKKIGILDGTCRLVRTDRMTGSHDKIEIHTILTDIQLAREDLLAILDGSQSPGLRPPPDTLTFDTRA